MTYRDFFWHVVDVVEAVEATMLVVERLAFAASAVDIMVHRDGALVVAVRRAPPRSGDPARSKVLSASQTSSAPCIELTRSVQSITVARESSSSSGSY